MARFYYMFENIALSPANWSGLVDKFRQRGAVIVPPLSPEQYIHTRINNDGQKEIFEANFNPNAVNAGGIIGQLVGIVGVPANRITYTQTDVDDLTTDYFVDGLLSLRQIVFGGNGTSWEQSHQRVTEYIQDNLSEWGSE